MFEQRRFNVGIAQIGNIFQIQKLQNKRVFDKIFGFIFVFARARACKNWQLGSPFLTSVPHKSAFEPNPSNNAITMFTKVYFLRSIKVVSYFMSHGTILTMSQGE